MIKLTTSISFGFHLAQVQQFVRTCHKMNIPQIESEAAVLRSLMSRSTAEQVAPLVRGDKNPGIHTIYLAGMIFSHGCHDPQVVYPVADKILSKIHHYKGKVEAGVLGEVREQLQEFERSRPFSFNLRIEYLFSYVVLFCEVLRCPEPPISTFRVLHDLLEAGHFDDFEFNRSLKKYLKHLKSENAQLPPETLKLVVARLDRPIRSKAEFLIKNDIHDLLVHTPLFNVNPVLSAFGRLIDHEIEYLTASQDAEYLFLTLKTLNMAHKRGYTHHRVDSLYAFISASTKTHPSLQELLEFCANYGLAVPPSFHDQAI